MSLVVLLVGTRTVKVIFSEDILVEQIVDKLIAIVESRPSKRKGRGKCAWSGWLRKQPAGTMVHSQTLIQPVERSTQVNVLINWPSTDPPQWPSGQFPGNLVCLHPRSEGAHRDGFLEQAAGLVVLRPCGCSKRAGPDSGQWSSGSFAAERLGLLGQLQLAARSSTFTSLVGMDAALRTDPPQISQICSSAHHFSLIDFVVSVPLATLSWITCFRIGSHIAMITRRSRKLIQHRFLLDFFASDSADESLVTTFACCVDSSCSPPALQKLLP